MAQISLLALLGIPLVLLVSAGLIALQIFLSLRAPIWPGLIIPACHLVLASLAVAGIFSSMRVMVLMLIIIVPSLIVDFAVYFICRCQLARRRENELKKMSIQDLG